MKLGRAMLCVEPDCEEVFEARDECRCPSCGSAVALPIAGPLNREGTPTAVEQLAPSNVLPFPTEPVLVFELEEGDVDAWAATVG